VAGQIYAALRILMFPWAASCRAIRANGIAAIGLSLLFLVTRLTRYRREPSVRQDVQEISWFSCMFVS